MPASSNPAPYKQQVALHRSLGGKSVPSDPNYTTQRNFCNQTSKRKGSKASEQARPRPTRTADFTCFSKHPSMALTQSNARPDQKLFPSELISIATKRASGNRPLPLVLPLPGALTCSSTQPLLGVAPPTPPTPPTPPAQFPL